MYQPELFDQLVSSGVIHLDVQVAQFLDQFSTSNQGSIMIVIGMAFAGSGFGMLWLADICFAVCGSSTESSPNGYRSYSARFAG
jgi:hypothetical protein